MLSKKIGIDPGTSTVRTYVKGEGVVVNEVSEADCAVTEEMLHAVIGKVQGRIRMFKPELMISVPSGGTLAQRRAVAEAAISAGARQVWLIDKPLAAAIGAGLPIHGRRAVAVCDVGGATTEVAVISQSGMVVARSIQVGGRHFDEAIARALRIDEKTAEQLKIAGEITSDEIASALQEPLGLIAAAIRGVLDETPAALAADIADRGVSLTGGGAQLRDLDRYLSQATGVPCALAEDPQTSVVRGTALALENLEVLKRNQAPLR